MNGGVKSLLAFWMGGAGAVAVVVTRTELISLRQETFSQSTVSSEEWSQQTVAGEEWSQQTVAGEEWIN